MKLKKQLTDNRSYEQLLNHYLVEKSLADKLKKANREERKHIHETMYGELFSKVPDHPRLTRRGSEQLTITANKDKFSLIKNHINKSTIFVEFAPGDCRFSYKVANDVDLVYGIDISNQQDQNGEVPENFKFIGYDGYQLNDLESNSIDVVFSDQLIEHIHPEDTKLHFELAHRILKKGGKYIFRAPHPMSGPHDVSAFFCDEAEGFHLKEWTYKEMGGLLKNAQYSKFQTIWSKAGIIIKLPNFYFTITENILSLFPKRYTKKAAKYLIPSLYGIAIK